MVRMSISKRLEIVDLRQRASLSLKDIARITKTDKRQVCRVIRKFRLHGTVENLPRKPRRRVTTRTQDQAIARMGQRFPHRKPRQVRAALGLQCSNLTVRRRWREYGLERRRARKKWFMNERHASLRKRWAELMLQTRASEWKRVLWCDEKTFRLGVYGVEWVTRQQGEALEKKNLAVNDRYAGKVQVSVSISALGQGAMSIFEENMDAKKYESILHDFHLPAARQMFGVARPWYLVHDNDRKHTAKLVKQFLARQHVRVLPWPAKSPDINVVENLWSVMTTKVHDLSPSTVEELKAALLQAWQSIDVEYLSTLVQSVPERLQAVIAADGWQTKY